MEENILRGPELKLKRKSFGQVIFECLNNGDGDKIAMVNAANGKKCTYNELLNQSLILSQYLQNNGLSKNDCVSICSENSLNYPVPVISALYLGICIAPICSNLTKKELKHILSLAKSKLIFCTLKTYETVSGVINGKLNQKIVLLDGNLPKNNVEGLEDILKNVIVNTNFKPLNIDVNENAVILFSSGTTGLPKGVILTHQSLNAGLSYNLDPNYGDFNSNKVGLAITGFYFGFGFMRLLAMLVAHMKIVVLPEFSTKLYLESIEKYRVTNIFLTPALVLFMARSPLVDNYDLSSIQEIMSGASALGKDIQEMALKRLKLKNIRQGYGLTETLAISLSPKNAVKAGSVGRLVPGKVCKIIDMDSGNSLGPHQQGEICVKGPHGMKAYVDNPEATATIIDRDGWYHTGDAGYFDAHGYLYVVDRYKELIKYNGFQVAPAEIEDLLLGHPGILDCAVVGKADARFGELATAFVVKQKNTHTTETDVIQFVEQNMSRQKWLHGGVKFITNIPRNSTGKILRRCLKEQLNKNPSKL